MLLEHKNAVIYGGAGAIGGTVAQAMAAAGARVFLAGRTAARLQAMAETIRAAGGRAEVDVLDAMDEAAVDRHAQAVAERAGGIDIALNAVGVAHKQGTGLCALSYEEFALPLHAYARTNFLTARAVARQMVAKERGGVLMVLSTPATRMAGGGFYGYGAACAVLEGFTRQMAGEFGPHGIRTVCLRPDAIPEALARGTHAREAFHTEAVRAGLTEEALLDAARRPATLLGRLPRLQEVADAAVFLASDRASAMTACIANLSCGSVLDL